MHCAVQEKPMTRLELQREFTIRLLEMAVPLRPQVGGGRIAHLLSDIWFDAVEHFITSDAQGRCKVCQKNICYICHKCNV